jgi:chlorobactene glucosyltransferase
MPEHLLPALTLLWGFASGMFLYAIGRTYLFRETLPIKEDCTGVALPLVTLVIPARNEEHNIEICLEGIITLDYPVELLQVVVVNDHSTDATRELVLRYAERYPHIELVDAAALPEGWMGKAHGCWMGAGRASGEWVAFIDADTYVLPRLLCTAVSYAQQHRLDLLSVIPFQIVRSRQERLWLPGFFLGIAASINFRRVNDPDDPYALANGQFLMFRRGAYDTLGGHEAIRGEISDDLAFAARAKEFGLNYYCLFGDGLIETRMYRSLHEIWRGFTKNLADIMDARHMAAVVLHAGKSMVTGLGFVFLPLAILGQWMCSDALPQQTLLVAIAFITLVLTITFIAVLRELRVPLRYTIACAFGLFLHGVVLINSYRKKLGGIREWKGRHYNL